MKKLWAEHRGFIVFFVLMFCFRSAIADWSDVPSGSMKPTLVEGDRISINKMAYDLRIPFSHISLYKIADPVRGDIVVFDSKAAGKRLVKRVIGLPGDTIAMENNQLFINGQKVDYQPLPVDDQLELLPGQSHYIRVNSNSSRYATFDAVTVPAGHYLMLGDNRDNSADSRVTGFVPRNELVGRSRGVVLSLDYDNYFLPRSERFFKELK